MVGCAKSDHVKERQFTELQEHYLQRADKQWKWTHMESTYFSLFMCVTFIIYHLSEAVLRSRSSWPVASITWVTRCCSWGSLEHLWHVLTLKHVGCSTPCILSFTAAIAAASFGIPEILSLFLLFQCFPWDFKDQMVCWSIYQGSS